jgi:hypothetical protein
VLVEIFGSVCATAITKMVEDYRFFRIDETQRPIAPPALGKMLVGGSGLNQLLLPDEHAALRACLRR